MKDYYRNKESSYHNYWDVNILHGWAVSQRLPVNGFVQVEDTFQINEDFRQNYNKKSDKGYFFKVDIQYLEELQELHHDLPFSPEKMKSENV